VADSGVRLEDPNRRCSSEHPAFLDCVFWQMHGTGREVAGSTPVIAPVFSARISIPDKTFADAATPTRKPRREADARVIPSSGNIIVDAGFDEAEGARDGAALADDAVARAALHADCKFHGMSG
jgi:hypothetical protein